MYVCVIWLGICRRRKKHLGAYYIDDLGDLSNILFESLHQFVLSGSRTRVQLLKTVVPQCAACAISATCMLTRYSFYLISCLRNCLLGYVFLTKAQHSMLFIGMCVRSTASTGFTMTMCNIMFISHIKSLTNKKQKKKRKKMFQN